MANYHGIAVNFGVSSSVASATGLFQTVDHNVNVENELIRDGSGEYVEKTYFGTNEEATFEYVATAAGGPAGNAAVTFPTPGINVTVTDTSYTNIAGTSWLVDGVTVKGSNTTAKRVTLKLTRYPNVSA